MSDGGPSELGDCICLTVDVEWAHPDVLADMTRALDERGLRATLFCTHAGIPAGRHERALHPNFRRSGDTMQHLAREHADFATWSEPRVYDAVVRHTKSFCPEAVGVRAHSLFRDTELAPVYRSHGLRYDSSVFLPFAPATTVVRGDSGVVELPIYYMDHMDIRNGMTDFRHASLGLDRPGLKVFDFHPNIVFINARSNDDYLESKQHYDDPETLLAMRREGRGIRTLFFELLDYVADRGVRSPLLREVCEALDS
jgi:hypothetical protein